MSAEITPDGLTLVTGGTGFVGAAIIRVLLTEGFRVRALARASSDLSNLEGLKVDVVRGDLLDGDSLRSAVRGCRYLFHAAADYRLWVPDPERLHETNVKGTESLMRASLEADVESIVYTSSVATLGHHADGTAAAEDTPVSRADMIGHYKRSKFDAEQAVRRLHEERGLPVVIVNPSMPLGPRDVKPTPSGMIIERAMAGKMPAYVDTGLNVVHVDDVAEGHLAALRLGRLGERYILAGDDMTLRDILTEVASLVDRRPPRIRLPHGLVVPAALVAEAWARLPWGGAPFVTRDGLRMARRKMYFSSAKARAELAYAPRPGVEAIRDAVEWFAGRA